MPSWDTALYLKYSLERTQPAVDLSARVHLEPGRIVDLGCGPGNSTAVVARRWPKAEIVGVDNSADMLAEARRQFPERDWIEADIPRWATTTRPGSWDLVFSNAALQWVPDHRGLFGPLFDAVRPGGALAFQMPYTTDLSHQRRMRAVAESWEARFRHPPAAWQVESAEFYYDALAPRAERVDLWITDYAHVLAGPEGVVEWYRGTGLRPYLEALPDDASRAAFLTDYLNAIAPDHPRRADGKVILYFRRLFVVAYRAG